MKENDIDITENLTNIFLLKAKGLALFGHPRKRINSWHNSNPTPITIENLCVRCNAFYRVLESKDNYTRCPTCREEHRDDRKKIKERQFTCKVCNKPFVDKWGKGNRVACGKSCGRLHRQSKGKQTGLKFAKHNNNNNQITT